MKRTKIIAVSIVMLISLSVFSVTAIAAAAYNTPAQAAACIIGKPVEEVISKKQESGKSYGAIAAEEGKLSEFKEEVLKIKKDHLQNKVSSGKITQEQADEAVKRIKENQANCDGTGNGGGVCQKTSVKSGQSNRNGQEKTVIKEPGNATGQGQKKAASKEQGNATSQGQKKAASYGQGNTASHGQGNTASHGQGNTASHGQGNDASHGQKKAASQGQCIGTGQGAGKENGRRDGSCVK